MKKVLFVCIHNSARSQMAEAYLNDLGKDVFIAESAGLEKGSLNPYAVKVMAEEGIDISNNTCDSVFDFHKEGRHYDLVVKVCDQINGERCPIFPRAKATLNWNLEDPSSLDGSDEAKLSRTREIRDQIKDRVKRLIEEYA
jgi:arsenate reductase (thioredoxin)